MASHEDRSCLPKGREYQAWIEAQAGRAWLKLAAQNPEKYQGLTFLAVYTQTYAGQLQFAGIQCSAKEQTEREALISKDGDNFVVSPSTHIENLANYFKHLHQWNNFFNLLSGTYLNKNKDQVLRILALNVLHPEPTTPEMLRASS